MLKLKKIDVNIIKQKEFLDLLKVERARADRFGHEFSLILFEINKMFGKKEIRKFITALKERIRVIDLIGWYGENTIGVILYSTKMDGANRFVQDIIEKPVSLLDLPAFTIFTYPDHWFGEETEKAAFNIVEKQLEQKFMDNEAVKTANEVTIADLKQGMAYKMPIWKRALDIIISFLALTILSPILFLVAGMIKIVSPGPVFFRQKRVGYKGRIFTLYKFRTMHMDNNQGFHQAHITSAIQADKPMEKLDNKKDPRIIKGGSFLRKSCLDEIPQLINVLKGEMTIVGPRPCIEYEAAVYSTWHKRRFDMMPGLTGLWQVSGKNKLSFREMVRLDIRYGEKMSLWFDLKIMLMTIPTIFGLLFEKVGKKFTNKKRSYYTEKPFYSTLKRAYESRN